MLVTGCGGGDSKSSEAAAASKSAKPSPSGTGTGGKLPGIKEFGLTEEEFAQHVEKTQALIAECMREAGFEYVPVDVRTVEAAQARVRQDPGYTRREYKEKWGLAVTTRFDNPVRDTGLGPQNLRIFKGLSEADQEAYNRTLFGDDPNRDFVFTLDEEDFSETGGCTRKAVAAVFTPEQLKGTYVNPKDVLVDNDPRIVKARAAWSKCMRAAGYDYLEDQDEIIEDFQDRLDELLDGDAPTELTGERAAELKKLQQEEIAASLADLDCQLKHTDKIYDVVEVEVYGQTLG
ncbi:MAG TPA: hypothetical protein VF314_12340 [Actinomycetes bacterium]